MALKTIEQAATLLRESQAPLIIIPEQPSIDAVAGALALLLVLEQMNKKPAVVAPGFTLPETHAFLHRSQEVGTSLSALRDLVISVNTTKVPLESLRYQVEKDQVKIFLTPKKQYFTPQDVSLNGGDFVYDAIVVLDAPSLTQLGQAYHDSPDFFYHTPLINIDHHPDNTRYGQIHLIDLVANSVSEILYELVRDLGEQYLTEHVATNLLAGIISKTQAFQAHTVTPRSLAIASQLVNAGARRNDIVQHLYQTKTLPMLRLWGRALMTLKTDADQTVIWSVLRRSDLTETQTNPDDAAGVLDELMVSSPVSQYYALFVEAEAQTEVYISVRPGAPTSNFPQELQARGDFAFAGKFNGTLDQAEQRVLEILRTQPRPKK